MQSTLRSHFESLGSLPPLHLAALVSVPVLALVYLATRRKKKQPELRYYENTLEDYTGSTVRDVNSEKIQATITMLEKDLEENYPVDFSVKGQYKQPDLYLGACGVAYYFWRKFKSDPSKKNHLESAQKYLAKIEELYSINTPPTQMTSIFLGIPGFYMTSCLVHKDLGNSKKAAEFYEKFCSHEKFATENTRANEMLYGECGYLLGSLILDKNYKKGAEGQNSDGKSSEVSTRVADHLVEFCRKTWVADWSKKEKKERMSAQFFGSHLNPLVPHFMHMLFENSALKRFFVGMLFRLLLPILPYTGWEFYGIAHGTTGQVYTALHVTKYAEQKSPVIQNTVDFFLENYSAKKIWPVKTGHLGSELVHWCHGAPGFVFFFGKAFEVYQEEKYKKAAEEAGEHVWNFGILKKGPGICHGISGNAYSMLYLYRITKDPKWLHRSLQFADYICTNFKNLRRADTPFSIFEGIPGVILFLEDILRTKTDPNSPRFPVFEDHI